MKEMTAKELVKWLESYTSKEKERVIRIQKAKHWLTGQDIENNIKARYLFEILGLLREEIERNEKKQKDVIE